LEVGATIFRRYREKKREFKRASTTCPRRRAPPRAEIFLPPIVGDEARAMRDWRHVFEENAGAVAVEDAASRDEEAAAVFQLQARRDARGPP